MNPSPTFTLNRQDILDRIANVQPTSYPERSQPTDFVEQRDLLTLSLRGSWLILSGYTANYERSVHEATRHIQTRPDVVAGILDIFFAEVIQ